MSKYSEYLERVNREWPGIFDDSVLDKRFIPYYNSGERIKVRYPGGETYFGTVGVTAGWRPVFLLMSRVTAIGSGNTLTEHAWIIGVKKGRKYVAPKTH